MYVTVAAPLANDADGAEIVTAGTVLSTVYTSLLKLPLPAPVPPSAFPAASVMLSLSTKFSPSWSPDGRYLAALDLENVSRKLFLFDFQTQKWSDWLTDPETIQYPAWTSDSRSMMYLSAGSTKRVKLGESQPKQLFSVKGFPQYFVPEFGPWNDNAPDDSRMFAKDASTLDIYSLDVDLP